PLKKYLKMIHYNNKGMLTLILEWALEWPTALAATEGDEKERLCTKQAYDAWKSSIQAGAQLGPATQRAIELLSEVLSPDALYPGLSARYRKEIDPGFKGARTIAPNLLRAIGKAQKECAEVAFSGDADQFEKHFAEYMDFVRGIHDGVVQYAQTYPTTVHQLLGQSAAEKMIEKSFSDCSFFELLWTLIHALDSKELAAFYADHLRTHFSGQGRGGSVQVIEEADRYRLVFDACGSGGAMRRRLASASSPAEVLPQATPATWSLAGQVPAYCSHCALNEIHSIERFGFPVAITEFDPDPSKPCGWTIYKDPHKIPDRYFERVGKTKDPKQFKKENWKYKIFRFLGITLKIKKRVTLPEL
ncbi:MAG: hypothetical protein ACJ763_10555, partial [Bdellovibrionia bacterium]